MTTTPLIQKIKGGTMITFQSAYEDMNLNITSATDRKFKFSNFALLNLPAIAPSTYLKNAITPDNIEGKAVQGSAVGVNPLDTDIIDFSETVQNYLLNLEALILSSDEYKRDEVRTVSQRVFFKWLKELGAIRFIKAPDSIRNNGNKFIEELDSDTYSRVVKYIGHIDMVGSNFASSSSSTELYLHVPSVNGSTPTVLFSSVSDKNYYPGMTIVKKSAGIEYINGRDSETTGVRNGVSTQALYDSDVPEGVFKYSTKPENKFWMGNRASVRTNAYYTDTNFSDVSTIEITRVRNGKSTTFKRSNLDGIELDLDIKSYVSSLTNDAPQSFNDLNSSGNATSFEYNTVAIFYDIIDSKDNILATNLYGFVILEDIVPTGIGISTIATTKKYKSSDVTGDQGNGIGIRINIKLSNDTRTITPVYEVSVNDYNTFSMELFENSIKEIITLNKTCNTLLGDNIKLFNYNEKLQSIASEIMLKNEALQKEVNDLKSIIREYVDSSSLSEELVKISDSIRDSRTIIDSITPTGESKLRNHYATFSIGNTITDPVTNLVPATSRYVIHSSEGKIKQSSSPLVITIDSTKASMEHNQMMDILFKDKIRLKDTTVEVYLMQVDGLGALSQKLLYSKYYALGIVDNISILCLNPITNEYYCK